MRCPDCQSELTENAKFCTICGCRVPTINIQPNFNDMQQSPLEAVHMHPAVCAACGTPLIKGVRFCTVCGLRVGSASPYLIRFRDNTMIKIDQIEFIIGKKQGAVNYCITDNKAVSRVHAKLINIEGRFCVIDMGSTNYTYVNRVRIPAHTQVPITSGTMLRFANEDFEFRIQ